VRALIILAAGAGLYLVFLWFARQPRKTQLQVAAVLIGAVLIALAATGRLNWIFALFGALLPFLRRLLPLVAYLPSAQRMYRKFRDTPPAAGQSATGRQSNVESRFVSMTLDHDSGEMQGRVLQGRFAGQALEALTRDQLLELFAECVREDEDSAALLRAYLDRVYGEAWQAQGQAEADTRAPGFSGAMTQQEAWAILGLDAGADEEQIINAHRRLMQKLHPDRGGSTYLAAKINQAKDLLLGKS
jgi:hypothetical protein